VEALDSYLAVARGHNRWCAGGELCEVEEIVYYRMCSHVLDMAHGLTADTLEGWKVLASKR
jgi:hypothetical protein